MIFISPTLNINIILYINFFFNNNLKFNLIINLGVNNFFKIIFT